MVTCPDPCEAGLRGVFTLFFCVTTESLLLQWESHCQNKVAPLGTSSGTKACKGTPSGKPPFWGVHNSHAWGCVFGRAPFLGLLWRQAKGRTNFRGPTLTHAHSEETNPTASLRQRAARRAPTRWALRRSWPGMVGAKLSCSCEQQ